MIRHNAFRPALAAATLALTALILGGADVLLAQAKVAVAVRDAWVRQPVGDRQEAGAFATVENSGATAHAIVAVSADVADKAELHEMKMIDAMMRMSPVKQIAVPAHGTAELKPGGYHVMLFGFKKRLMAGDAVTLTFTLDDGSSVSAVAAVRQVDGMAGDPAAPRK